MKKHSSIKEDRNDIRRQLPKTITIAGVNDTFSLMEVVSDGRCFFGSFWLLSLTPEEIRMYMTDPDGYEAMDNFVDNALSGFIKNEIFAKASKCQKMTMMRTHYFDNDSISGPMAEIFGEDIGGSFLMDHICKAQEADLDTETLSIIDNAYKELTRRGLIKEFDKYLMSYYQSKNEFYTDADPFLLGNFMSDLFGVNVNIVRNQGGNSSIFLIDPAYRFTGNNDPVGKEEIYIYYRHAHFQPMIPNSILERDIRPPVAQTSANVSSLKRKTPIETLKESFPTLDEDIITQVYEANNQDFTEAYHGLAEMEEGPKSKAPRNNRETSSQVSIDPDNFIFKIPLKIKYALNNKFQDLKDLPSTGSRFNIFSKGYSSTNRITGDVDSVYSKTQYNLDNNALFKGKGYVLESSVEVCNDVGVSQPPENWENATPDWYFRVNLKGNIKGGRTRKRGRVRSHKKRKTHTRGRRTKQRRFSQTKHQRNKTSKK